MDRNRKNNIEYLIYFVALFGILAGTLIYTSKENVRTIVKYKTVNKIVYVDTCNLFQVAINHLKEYEGFRSNIYFGVNGQKTIGYGHQLTKGESYKVINESQAERILVEDFNKHLNYVKSKTNLLDNQSIALALFSFNVGQGNLDKAIGKGLLSNIDKLSLYSYYKSRNRYVKSKGLYQRRLFELHLFKLITKTKK